MTRRYLLEQVDDAAVVQVYADGFESLPLEQKMLVVAPLSGRACRPGHLLRPALPSRARDARDPRRDPDARRAASTPDGLWREIRRYTKLFWINSGPHNNITARKFVLKCTPEQLSDAAHRAEAAWRVVSDLRRRDARRLLERLRGPFFDPARRSDGDEQDAGPGSDILAASANNLYRRRDDGRPRRVRGALRAQLAARQERRPARRAGVPDCRTLRRSDRSRPSVICSTRCRTRRRRCAGRSKR